MFLRIEGFQVEIKEINKTWERPASIKNFNIGESLLAGLLVTLPGGTAGYYLNRMMFSEKQTLKVEKFHPLSSGQSMFTSLCVGGGGASPIPFSYKNLSSIERVNEYKAGDKLFLFQSPVLSTTWRAWSPTLTTT